MPIFSNFFDTLLLKISTDKKSIEYNKTKTLIIVILASSLLILLLGIKVLVVDGPINSIASFSAFFVMLSVLLVVKSGRPILAGNILSFFLLGVVVLEMLTNPQGRNLPYYQIGQYYVFPAIILFAAMFASRISLLSVVTIVLISTFYIYFSTKAQIPENVVGISKSGFFLYETVLVIFSVLSYVFTGFLEKAMKIMIQNSKDISFHNQQLHKVIDRTKISSEELAQASNRFTSVSQLLSQSAGRQSFSLQQISFEIGKILNTINENAENASDTSIRTKTANKNLGLSSEVILQTIDLVHTISRKTEVISNIAFQTNILSLNASIQAAKAGIYGKGFSVVAEEIRNLAEVSTKASQEIEELVTQGAELSAKADDALMESMMSIEEITLLTNNIANSSNEHKDGIQKINNAINELTELANNNSSTSEEMSASSEELFAQAESLKEIISSIE